MKQTRRQVVLGLLALGLTGCSRGGVPCNAALVTARAAETPPLPTVPNAGWDAWVAGFRPRAVSSGIAERTFDTAFSFAGFVPGVIERDRNQTETTRTLEDYLAIAASTDRIGLGQQNLAGYGSLLAEVEARYGIEAHVLASVWGLESRYGTRRGNIPVISSTSTLAYEGRRANFFQGQLMAALRILQNGDITPSRMTGSWAGAMGHTQFIPTSYEAYAVDFRGDGRRDIWADDPTDALASTGAYLARSGWTRGQPWGVEVQLPPGINTALTGRSATRSTSEWASLGVRDMRGREVPDYGSAAILLPDGATGPAFMIFGNFAVIARYNNSEKYVIGVGHLSDRLLGRPPIQGDFAPDANGLTQADRRRIQERLTAAGFDTQGTDGVIGSNTEAAIRAYEAANRLSVTGIATRRLLQGLG
ncbi:MAG: lytic murein transglycosylase [Flavimaricola sp.]|nr:lytic murein transglycosylase [Flavimaricola sp.]